LSGGGGRRHRHQRCRGGGASRCPGRRGVPAAALARAAGEGERQPCVGAGGATHHRRKRKALRLTACVVRLFLHTDRSGPSRPGRSVTETQRADRKSTRLNSSHVAISYAVFCLKKKKKKKYKQRKSTMN